jgi:glycerol uptake facilitator protein
MKERAAVYFGEFLGTFLLVFIGTSAVAVAVLFNALIGLQVAAVWGLGVTLAIYATRHLSCAHLNPAVSLGMVLAGRMHPRLLLPYWAFQLLGGIAAGATVLLVFHGNIVGYESANAIIRGSPESMRTAMMFGEYFPNPGVPILWFKVSMGSAMLVEGIGTFILVLMIFLLTEGCNVGRPSEGSSPIFVGGTVSAIIAITAPLTQAGINPARDFGPRIISFLAGWGSIAIPGPKGGFFWVYIAAPLLGGAAAAACFRFIIAPLMSARTNMVVCTCEPDNSERSKG